MRPDPERRVLVSLCGGGAWGAYQAGCIEKEVASGKLLGYIKDPTCILEINGVSIGALNAVHLARGVATARTLRGADDTVVAEAVLAPLREYWLKRLGEVAPMDVAVTDRVPFCLFCCYCPLAMCNALFGNLSWAMSVVMDRMFNRWDIYMGPSETLTFSEHLRQHGVELSFTVAAATGGGIRRVAWGSALSDRATGQMAVVRDALKASMFVEVRDESEFRERWGRCNACQSPTIGTKIRMTPGKGYLEGGRVFNDAANAGQICPIRHVGTTEPLYRTTITPCPSARSFPSSRTAGYFDHRYRDHCETMRRDHDNGEGHVWLTDWDLIDPAVSDNSLGLLVPLFSKKYTGVIDDMYRRGAVGR